MEPEERLDALLSHRQSADLISSDDVALDGASDAEGAAPSNSSPTADSALSPLLAAANTFAVWGTAVPDVSFAEQLEADLLARFALHSEGAIVSGMPGVVASPNQSDQEQAGPSQDPSQSGGDDSAERRVPASPGRTARVPLRLLGRPARLERPRATRAQVLQRSLVAAAVLIAAVGSLAVSAATARPGQPLYGVLRFEQGVRTDMANTPDERIRLQLRYAHDALAAYEVAISQQSGEQAYHDALASFLDDEQAAAGDIAALTEGTDRDRLTAQLMTLRAQGQGVLRTSLHALNWPMRATVTMVLGQLGDDVLQIAQATVSGASRNGNYIWTIAVDGADFAPGAVLLVDGHPLGSVVSLSPTRLVAEVSSGQLSGGAHSIGVGNADGTASMVTGVTTTSAPDDHGGHGDHGTPGPQSTSGADDHGGSGGSGSGGGGSGGGDGHGG
jgi:hypothetical protein